MAHEIQIVIDCADPAALAEFWAAALGYVVQPPPDGFPSWESALDAWGVPAERRGSASAVVDPAGVGPRVFFQRVAEPKSVKNRVHLDVRVSPDGGWPAVLAHVDRLEALGARRTGEHEEMGSHWITCLDPEGNEFDVA